MGARVPARLDLCRRLDMGSSSLLRGAGAGALPTRFTALTPLDDLSETPAPGPPGQVPRACRVLSRDLAISRCGDAAMRRRGDATMRRCDGAMRHSPGHDPDLTATALVLAFYVTDPVTLSPGDILLLPECGGIPVPGGRRERAARRPGLARHGVEGSVGTTTGGGGGLRRADDPYRYQH